MSASDVDLFAKSAFQKSRNIGRQNFQPTFDDELPYDPVIAGKCNNVSSCISDAVISGLVAVGVNTKQGIQETQTKAAETSGTVKPVFASASRKFFKSEKKLETTRVRTNCLIKIKQKSLIEKSTHCNQILLFNQISGTDSTS